MLLFSLPVCLGNYFYIFIEGSQNVEHSITIEWRLLLMVFDTQLQRFEGVQFDVAVVKSFRRCLVQILFMSLYGLWYVFCWDQAQPVASD